MKRFLVVCFGIALFAIPFSSSAQTSDAKALKLLQLLADQGQGAAEVLVGALPAGMPKVPLPADELIGSVHHKPMQVTGSFSTGDSYDLYYQGDQNSEKHYEDTLAAAGFTTARMPLFGQGGFESNSGPRAAIYCKQDGPSLSITADGANERDLRIDLNTGDVSKTICSGGDSFMHRALDMMMPGPLPDLQAPAGIKMTAASVGMPNARSAAHIVGGSSAAALVDAFSSQMVKAGWKAGHASADQTIASQSFTMTDAKKNSWQCILTVYAVEGKPGEFLAFVDETNLANIDKATGFSIRG